MESLTSQPNNNRGGKKRGQHDDRMLKTRPLLAGLAGRLAFNRLEVCVTNYRAVLRHAYSRCCWCWRAAGAAAFFFFVLMACA